MELAGQGDGAAREQLLGAIGRGCGRWSPCAWTAGWRRGSTRPTSCRTSWPRPTRDLSDYLRDAAAAVLSLAAAARLGAAGRAAPPPRPRPAAQRRPRGGRHAGLPDESAAGPGRAAAAPAGPAPASHADPRGDARARPGGPGAAGPSATARSWSCGYLEQLSTGRDRRGAGHQRGGRQDAPACGPWSGCATCSRRTGRRTDMTAIRLADPLRPASRPGRWPSWSRS